MNLLRSHIWSIAFGILISSFIPWLAGFPPSLTINGIGLYPQMLISLCVVVVALFINKGGPPTHPA